MNYNFTEITFPSSDGKNTIYAEIYTPKAATAKGIVQLAHGMTDYTGRYTLLADYLTARGYILAGNHHLGHGRSAASDDDLGYFGEKGGLDYVVDDLKLMNDYLTNTYPALPIVLLGHSMGSFLSRIYTTKYPLSVRGVVILGTGGKNPLVGMGIMVAKLVRLFCGARHRSKLIDGLAFGNYNSRYPKEEGENAWLTRDIELVSGRGEDKFTSFKFTVSGYHELFLALKKSNERAWYKSFPKQMPTLVVSGDMDPVGNYGKGPLEVANGLMVEGCTDVTLKLYPGARHELFNEINREEFFADLVEWLGGVVR